ncbi:MAG: 16S rRNA (guanine(966)-N(2))-methyltransferase RsmD [Mailhella sp.]|nr:16S rRNA (guanine(966)-N(2))-methyltransferase RsmD [Mailhella sp.]
MRIIAGAYKGRILRTASGPGYRPAMGKVRESIFSLLESRGAVWSDMSVLDLFAGSGSLGFEALSRGARRAVFVEQDAAAAKCLAGNIASLGVGDKAALVTSDAVAYAGRGTPESFDAVFIDPPYALDLLPVTLRALLRKGRLNPGAFIIAEVERHFQGKTDGFAGLTLELDRLYGQTRIIVWIADEDQSGGIADDGGAL